MQHVLNRHKDTRCDAVSAIAVTLEREKTSALVLNYVVTGRIGELALPERQLGGDIEALWRHTCFEAFVRARGNDAYCEFNFAPSGQWAAYRFDSYREGMRELELPLPRLETANDGMRYSLRATVEVSGLTRLRAGDALRVGLSAVIEEKGGRLSYWALAHPEGKPDFHHRDCFVLQVPAAMGA